MPNKTPYEEPQFDFPNYEYFKVSNLDLFEFKLLAGQIADLANKKVPIDKTIITRFYSLLKLVKDEPVVKSDTSDEDIAKGLVDVLLYIGQQRNRNQYIFGIEEKEKPTDLKIELKGVRQIITVYGDFKDMLLTVTENLRMVEAKNHMEWAGNKDFCMKEAFKEFAKYYWWCMSVKQQENYMIPYKFVALSAVLADMVWKFGISESKDMKMHTYNKHATHALKKYHINPQRLLDTPPPLW